MKLIKGEFKEVLDRIFVQGVQYKRAGVIVMGISPNGKGRAEVFARSTSGRLLPTGRKNAIKHDFKSKNPTTRWSDIIKLK